MNKKICCILQMITLLGMVFGVNVLVVSACYGYDRVPGDFDDNGDITLSEAVKIINQYENNQATLSDVTQAINIWNGSWSIEQIGDVDVVFRGSLNRGVAKVYFKSNDGIRLSENSCWYAEQIINKANKKGYKVIKSRSNMAYEIRAHVYYFIAESMFTPCDKLHSNPIDIELYTGNWVAPGWWDLPWPELPCL